MEKKWWFYLPVQLLGLFLLYNGLHANKADFAALYRAKAASKIASLESGDHSLSVTVELGDEAAQRYRFFPVGQQGGVRGFLATAAIGDSLWKRPFSDTLFLVQQHRVLPYSFSQDPK